ncbi:MAG: SPOR domain-containing protein [Rhodospirillales bacterium]
MASRLVRLCAALALTATLSACAGMREMSLFQGGFWDNSVFVGSDEAELGIAELTKGNYIAAENRFKKALKANPKDVHALIGAGILYQNTGQTTRAREMYEAVLALRPSDADQFIVLQDISTRPVAQIASVNLGLIESGGVTGAMTSGQPAASSSVNAMPQAMPGAMQSGMMNAGAAQPMRTGQAPQTPRAPMDMSARIMFSADDANIVSRFTTMRALRDQGLVTPDEFSQRRQANIGALLPLTSPPPAAGLGRPVPATEEVSSRLTAIGRALQMRAISVTQHASERIMILDALMPSAPVMVMHAAAPPQGLLQAADSVRRLEKLREDGFITSDEYVRERGAIEAAIQTTPTGVPASQADMAPAMAPGTMMTEDAASGAGASMSGRPAVHLASYKSRKNADRGWTQMRRAHAGQLDGLTYAVSQVDLGSKGVFHRLIAGPLGSRAEAASLCRDLKRRRQFCEPSVMP